MFIFILLGIVSSIFQLTIFREFTYSLAKNEFSFILGVGIWLIFCSLGSRIARDKKTLYPVFLPLAFALVFSLVISAIHLVKTLAGLAYYETASLVFVFISAICLISPVSFLIGYSFSTFSRRYLNTQAFGKKTFGKFFAYEAIGFFIGGILFTFFLSSYFNPFIFSFLSLLLLLAPDIKAKTKVTSSVIMLFLSLVFLFSFKPILKTELNGSDILISKGSKYGPIILAKKSGVESLYANGSQVATSEDKAGNEEFIHSVFAASSAAGDVLFIGPCFTGQIREILKYNIDSLDCLDINPVLTALSKEKIGAEQKKRVKFIVDDPRRYLRETKKRYDCIIMNTSAPTNLALNRYFSLEFFRLIKERLTDKGVFSFRIPSAADILSPRIKEFNSCIINTLGRVFKNRLLIPSDSMIIIAGLDKDISPDSLIKNFQTHNVPADYFTAYHLKDSLDPERINYIESNLDKRVGINSDFNFQGFLYYSLVEQAKFYPRLLVNISRVRAFIAVSFVILILFVSGLNFSGKKVLLLFNASIAGFLSIGLCSIIFVLFQLYSGALFWKLGILMGIFMAGLSLGAFLVNLSLNPVSKIRKPLPVFYLSWFMFLIVFLAVIKLLNQNPHIEFIFYGCSFATGLLTGSLYPILSKLMLTNQANPQKIAASIYTADLAGAALGTLIFSIFLIPFLGIEISLLMVMFLALAWALKESFS